MAMSPTYAPLNVLKPVCDGVRIVDGPLIDFGPPWLHFPFPTRMTVVRAGEALFVHSPTPLTTDLAEAVRGLGAPRWLIGPSTIHYWWLPEWRAAFPDAGLFLAPGVIERAKGRIASPHAVLDRDEGWPWSDAIRTWVFRGRGVSEVVFFHRASRTLILTDFIENFEAERIASPWARAIARLGGVIDPDGSMPRDMRLAYRRERPRLRAAMEEMIALDPARVILAHGRWYEENGAAELRRAFGWLL